MDGDLVKKSNAVATEEVLRLVQQRLEASSTLEITAAIRQSLAAAVGPGLELLQSLHNQLEDYSIEMIPAHDAGEARAFEPRYMENEAAEEAGSVKASIFPVLYKMIDGEDGIKVSISLSIIGILLTY